MPSAKCAFLVAEFNVRSLCDVLPTGCAQKYSKQNLGRRPAPATPRQAVLTGCKALQVGFKTKTASSSRIEGSMHFIEQNHLPGFFYGRCILFVMRKILRRWRQGFHFVTCMVQR